MTTYKATSFSDQGYAKANFAATTPHEALKLAREYESNNIVCVEAYSEPIISQILIDDDEGECAEWQSDDLRPRLAATDLLQAAHLCEMALSDIGTAKRKGYLKIALQATRAAIAKAKGGAS
jgi:hypothetical protein